MTLNKSIQLEREIRKAGIFSTSYYSQFTTHPKEFLKLDNIRTSGKGVHSYYRPFRKETHMFKVEAEAITHILHQVVSETVAQEIEAKKRPSDSFETLFDWSHSPL